MNDVQRRIAKLRQDIEECRAIGDGADDLAKGIVFKKLASGYANMLADLEAFAQTKEK